MDAISQRKAMVDQQIARRGVRDGAVLAAMGCVPREEFVPASLIEAAYQDGPLPIGHGQTISQPYIVALMAQAAQILPGDRILEIGTGSGYSAAILAQLGKEVFTVERIPPLALEAEERFKKLGYLNVHAKVDDGTLGWPEKGPFDAIVVTAGAPVVPETLLQQLVEGGRIVIPVGDQFSQELLRLTKKDQTFTREILEYVRFVPLIGKAGWHDAGR